MIEIYPQGEYGWNKDSKSSNDCEWDNYECTTELDDGALIAAIRIIINVSAYQRNMKIVGRKGTSKGKSRNFQ